MARVSRRTRRRQAQAVDPLQQQIMNAQTRLNAVGMGNHDSRNVLERAFNLPEGQNAFFDIMDVLQRPLQAVTNATNALVNRQDTRNPLTAAMQGLGGQSKVGGTEILEGLGLDPNRADTKLLGFLGDVALDPVTYIPGGAIAKGAKAVGSGAKSAARAVTPAPIMEKASQAKEALENMFSVEAPLRRTLDGGTDDALVQLRRQGINDERYLTQKIQDDVLGAVKNVDGKLDEGVRVGRNLERDLGLHDVENTDFNLVMRRYAYESHDPEIKRAAQVIMDSNEYLRNFAAEAGITVPDIEGYMAHVLTKEAREALAKYGGTGKAGIGGDSRVLKRQLEGTAEEINERMREDLGYGFDFFEPNAFFATAHGQRRLMQYVLAERAKVEVLSNPAFAQKIDPQKGQIIKLGKNEELIDVKDYNFFRSEAEEILGEAAGNLSGKYIVTKGAKQLLDNYKEKLSDEGVKQFLGTIGKIQEWWKKLALFSPGYHVRNDIGNKFNAWISGMPLRDIPKYTTKVAYQDRQAALKAMEKQYLGQELTDAERLAIDKYDMFRKQGLSASGMSSDFRTDPNKAIDNQVRRAGMTTGQKAWDSAKTPFQTSQDFGNFVDEMNRYGYFRWLLDKGKAKTPEEAAAKVREVMFDYGDITETERMIKTVIPFYTWMRKNIPFQLANLATKPGKYSNLDKAIETMYELSDLDAENDVPDWLRDALAVPIPSPTGGDPLMINLRPPASDLAEIMERPLKTLSGAVSPLFKLPIELGANTNTFLQRPIEEFEGQTKPFFGAQVPAKLQHALQSSLGQIGNVSTNVSRLFQDDGNGSLAELMSLGLIRQTRPEQQQTYNQYEALQELEDLMRLYEQRTGSRPPTMRDLQR